MALWAKTSYRLFPGDGEMLISAEERVAYWGYRNMNFSCRDINDDEEPDILGLERILYGVGFLAVTDLRGISAWDEDTPAEEEEEETEYEAVDSELNPFDYEASDEDAIKHNLPFSRHFKIKQCN